MRKLSPLKVMHHKLCTAIVYQTTDTLKILCINLPMHLAMFEKLGQTQI